MTPALKAMVEAMAAAMPDATIHAGEVLVSGSGWVSLEKVARAGLAAIRDASPDEDEAWRRLPSGLNVDGAARADLVDAAAEQFRAFASQLTDDELRKLVNSAPGHQEALAFARRIEAGAPH